MKTIDFSDTLLAQKLFGFHNANLDKIAKAFDIKLNSRGNSVTLEGNEARCESACTVLNQVYDLLSSGTLVSPAVMDAAIGILKKNPTASLKPIFKHIVFTTAKRKPITPRNLSQLKYAHAIEKNDILFGIGPAGTGKTYLAMAMAVAALARGEVQKIILTRPAVEAGEALGFLPGDLTEKINPYLRPLYDALYDMLDFDKARAYIDQEIIEIAPIAFMRGRTLNNAFVILDEAQNTTSEQMKMFLTRIGYGSKAIVTGDITQIDLPTGRKSGLVEARRILSRIKGIEFILFSKDDVVRHGLVSRIIDAYEKTNK